MTELAHKDRTLQDIIDAMTSDQRELMDLVVGAAVEDEVIDDDDLLAEVDDLLTDEQLQVITFVVGSVLAQKDEAELAQSNLRVNEFLEHYGVKGMQWGVRKRSESGGSGSASKSQQKPAKLPKPPKLVGNAGTVKLSGSTRNTEDERSAARAKVRSGKATAEDAHVAALKSTGHRVANAFLGDKTYWKGTAIAAGVTAGVVGATLAAPAVLPASVLGAIGSAAFGGSAASAASVASGSGLITSTGLTAAYVGAQIASSVLQIKNVYRAVTGNAKIDDSYARLGATAAQNYRNGNDRMAKTLRRYGGLSGRKVNKALKQSDDLRVSSFLEHHLETRLEQMLPGA